MMALLTVFSIGIGLMVSVLNVYFRDMLYLVGIFLQIWFYATPIVYPVTTVPVNWEVRGYDIPLRAIYELNPMTAFVETFRELLYDLRFPDWTQVLYVSAWSFALLIVGIMVFRRFEGRLAEEL